MAKRRHATLARFEGAATGVGGIFTRRARTWSALAWIQSRLVFFIAAAYGYDPRDPMRPAELLVLTDLYDDVRDGARGARRHRQDDRRGLRRLAAASARRRSPMRLAKMVGKRGDPALRRAR